MNTIFPIKIKIAGNKCCLSCNVLKLSTHYNNTDADDIIIYENEQWICYIIWNCQDRFSLWLSQIICEHILEQVCWASSLYYSSSLYVFKVVYLNAIFRDRIGCCRLDWYGSGWGIRQILLNMVMNFQAEHNVGKLFSNQATGSFSRTQLHGASYGI
jgi:hypothetical protein